MPALDRHASTWHTVEPTLQVADIILVHGKGPLNRAIQRASKSYWNHVALVLQPAQPAVGIKGAFIIGAIDRGIEIHRLRKYSEHLDRFDIGVKRFPGLTLETRKRIVSFLLNELDASYDYTRLFAYLAATLIAPFSPRLYDYIRRAARTAHPNSYVCSTFIQRAFFLSVPSDRELQAFARSGMTSLEELEEIKPAAFPHSPHYEWIFNPHE